jgi:PHP family Zn ribbon phosphoesterase
MLPGIGARTCHKLLVAFGSEIAVLHRVPLNQIAQVAGTRVAGVISAARDGSLHIDPGGGGRMGRASLGGLAQGQGPDIPEGRRA